MPSHSHAATSAPLPTTTIDTGSDSKECGSNVNQKPLWQPSSDGSWARQMIEFTRLLHRLYPETALKQLPLGQYQPLYQWSVENISQFWSAVWQFTGVIHSQPFAKVVDETIPMDQVPVWFEGARLNFAENLLRFRDDRLAIIATGEYSSSVETEIRLTYRQLFDRVQQAAGCLKQLGVGIGDRVVGYLPNCVESVVFMLATAALGAIWSCTSPDFGTAGVLDRFEQVQPRILISVNAVVYNGKVYDHLDKVKAVVDGLSAAGLQNVIIVPFIASHRTTIAAETNDSSDSTWMVYGEEMISKLCSSYQIQFEQLPFNHPLYILYSSGTTGKPKCIVHSAGGVLIQHLKEHILHGDFTRDDVFFQYTTTGWMMWNWLVSALATGCTIVLYDGSPFKPSEWILWDLADRLGVTRFGTSAKYLQSMEEMRIHPRERFQLPHLRDIYSTGSVLRPESFDFVYQHIKSDICLGSITGGTDIVSLFAGHCHLLPVYRGEIQCRCLGMAVECWDDQSSAASGGDGGAEGKSVYGQSGDLVCRRPFPCMPVFFWGDDPVKRTKYTGAYFDHYPHVWYHGDYLLINPHTGGLIMLGRSDGTLKPAGVRFGSAELYNVIDRHFSAEVADSLAVGQRRPQDTDERVVLFLKMQPGNLFDAALVGRVKSIIRQQLSPRHVPAVILPVAEIPYTVNGKKVEIAVKKIISGQTYVPSGTLSNPECLKLYEQAASGPDLSG